MISLGLNGQHFQIYFQIKWFKMKNVFMNVKTAVSSPNVISKWKWFTIVYCLIRLNQIRLEYSIDTAAYSGPKDGCRWIVIVTSSPNLTSCFHSGKWVSSFTLDIAFKRISYGFFLVEVIKLMDCFPSQQVFIGIPFECSNGSLCRNPHSILYTKDLSIHHDWRILHIVGSK